MSREYIPLFLDFNDSTQDLTDEECGRLVRSIVDYANGKEYESKLVGAEKIAFRFLKGAIDRNQAISEVRSKAGASKKKSEQTETNDSKTEQSEANFINKKRITKNNNENKKQKQEQEERFARFWTVYPRKEAKPKAHDAFMKINPDKELLEKMIASVEKWKDSDQWKEDGGKYIPHPTTWLNQQRWNDEPQKRNGASVKQVVVAQQYEQRDYSGYHENPDDILDKIANGVLAG